MCGLSVVVAVKAAGWVITVAGVLEKLMPHLMDGLYSAVGEWYREMFPGMDSRMLPGEFWVDKIHDYVHVGVEDVG